LQFLVPTLQAIPNFTNVILFAIPSNYITSNLKFYKCKFIGDS
jgi:hypothetical protein